MGKFQRGAARIALAMGVDILPIVITVVALTSAVRFNVGYTAMW